MNEIGLKTNFIIAFFTVAKLKTYQKAPCFVAIFYTRLPLYNNALNVLMQ